MSEQGIRFEPDANGNLRIFDVPRPGRFYIIGADIGEGIKDGCWSTAFVLDTTSKSQAAEYRARIDPVSFAGILTNLALYYNNALLAPESWPGPGAITCSHIFNTHQYPNIYRRPHSPHSQKKQDDLLGWETNKRTRPKMFYTLDDALRKYELVIYSKQLLLELRGIIIEDGHIKPPANGYSDLTIAAAIAWQIYILGNYSKPENMRHRPDFLSSPSKKVIGYGVRKE